MTWTDSNNVMVDTRCDEITLFDQDMDGSMEPCDDGGWVRAEDHFAEIDAAEKRGANAMKERCAAICEGRLQEGLGQAGCAAAIRSLK